MARSTVRGGRKVTITEERRPEWVRDGVEVAWTATPSLPQIQSVVAIHVDLRDAYDLRRLLWQAVLGAPAGAELHLVVGDRWPELPPAGALHHFSLIRVEASQSGIASAWREALHGLLKRGAGGDA